MEKRAADEKENEMKERKVEFDWFQNMKMHDNLRKEYFLHLRFLVGAREGQQETAEGEGIHACRW